MDEGPEGTSQSLMDASTRSVVSVNSSNAVPPVHCLPTEILSQTFQVVLSPVEQEQYYPQLQYLSAVCRRWWDLVDNSPLFWNRIQKCDGPPIWEKALKKSSSYPLDVWFQGAFYELQDFLHQLRPHISRCRKMRISYNDAGSKVDDVLAPLFLPTASLETFHLIDEGGWITLDKMELFGGQAPSLQEIKLAGIVCDWRSGVFSGLTVLQISWSIFPTLGHLLGVLVRCNSLRQLVLTYNKFESLDVDANALANITLTHLQHLSIGSFERITTERLLEEITTPNCHHFHLVLRDGLDPKEIIAQRCATFLARMRQMLEGSGWLNLTLSSHWIRWEVPLVRESESSSCSMTYITEGRLAAMNLAAVIDVLQPNLPSVQTGLRVENSEEENLKDGMVLTQLDRLPKISQLQFGDVHSRGWDEPDIDNVLTNPIHPLFHHLNELIFYYQPLQFILHVVRALFTGHGAAESEERRPRVEIYVQTELEMEAIRSSIRELEESVGRGRCFVQIVSRSLRS